MIKTEIIEMYLHDIHANKDNPRIIKDDKYRKLKQSLKDFPEMKEIREIVIDENNMILGGNMRYNALIELHEVKAICKKVTGLTEEQKKEFIIKDNIGYGEWDWDVLANSWDEIKLNDWGLDIPGWDVPEIVEDYDIPDDKEIEDIKTDIQIGDLFEIGNHRLLCGDSTNVNDVNKLMNGNKADIIFFDPPHNENKFHYLYEKEKERNINSSIFWCTQDIDMINFLKNRIDDFHGFFIYDFHFGIQSKDQPFLSHFLIARMNKSKYNFINMGEGLKTVIRYGLMRGIAIKEFKHNQSKHIDLLNDILKSHKGNIIYDPFIGSGTTMVASQQLDRICYGMELEPKYCQITIDRMKKLFPDLIIKKNGIVI